MVNLRIRFAKTGFLQYIGHLDIMRTFQKIFRRAGIPLCFSQGYNPHPLMSFASPLGVGLTSEGEYLDLVVEEITSSDDYMRRINDACPEGLRILSCRLLPEGSKNAMSIIGMADYMVSFFDEQTNYEEISARLAQFLSAESILVRKKTKKQVLEMDLRPLIHEARLTPDGFYLKLSAGSVTNLKPEFVFESMFEQQGCPFRAEQLRIHRMNIYTSEGVSLEAMGEDVPA